LKKILILITLAGLLFAGIQSLNAASSCTEAWYSIGNKMKVVRLVLTAHTDGTFTPVTLSRYIRGTILMAKVYPDTAAGHRPSNGFTLTFSDSLGQDLFGGSLASLDSFPRAGARRVPILSDSVSYPNLSNNKPTVAFSGNTQSGARVTLDVFYRLGD
jgi:hypothetical protein